MEGYKTSLNELQKPQIIPSIFPEHNGVKLEINNSGKIGKFTNVVIKQYMLKQPVGQRSHREISKYLETNENKDTTFQNLGEAAKGLLRGNFTAINVYIKKKISNQQPHFIPSVTRERISN